MMSRTIAKKIKILGILWVFPLLLASCKTDTRTNAEQYQDDLKEYREKSDFHSQLYIYPESLNGEIVKYIISETEDLFNGSYFFYLVLNFDEKTFDSELQRLSEIKSVFTKHDNRVKPILHYPEQSTYLTIKRGGRYEYVLYDKESLQIAYVSNQLYDWSNVPLEPEHILPNVRIPEELYDGSNTYNMYYLYDGNAGTEVVD